MKLIWWCQVKGRLAACSPMMLLNDVIDLTHKPSAGEFACLVILFTVWLFAGLKKQPLSRCVEYLLGEKCIQPELFYCCLYVKFYAELTCCFLYVRSGCEIIKIVFCKIISFLCIEVMWFIMDNFFLNDLECNILLKYLNDLGLYDLGRWSVFMPAKTRGQWRLVDECGNNSSFFLHNKF